MGREEALKKAEALFKSIDPNYTGEPGVNEIDNIGYMVSQGGRGGGTIIIGNDGGLLYTNFTGAGYPENLIQAYKDGKRTDESSFTNAAEKTSSL